MGHPGTFLPERLVTVLSQGGFNCHFFRKSPWIEMGAVTSLGWSSPILSSLEETWLWSEKNQSDQEKIRWENAGGMCK